ncbi:MAG: polysaccharide biosynthesis protein [Gemmatimonadales bacterium]
MSTQSRLFRAGVWVYETAYSFRKLVAFTLYSGAAAVSYLLAYLIRFDFTFRPAYVVAFWASLPILLAIRVACSMFFRLSTGRWRFIGARDVIRLMAATSVGTVLFFTIAQALPLDPAIPRSVVLIEWVLTSFLTAGMWIVYRLAYEQWRHHLSGFNGSATRALIVGAGEAGILLAREMGRFPTGYRPIGLVDDDPSKWGMVLQGLEVIGSTRDLKVIAEVEHAEEIIIAVPSAPPAELRRIVETCESTGLKFKVLPGIAEVLAGDIRLNQLRDVRIEDLLGRDPIQLTLPELATELSGSSVLITGAAGSIGSELARQIALHGPASLVLFDQAETDLFYLELELREKHPGVRLAAVVGDVVETAAVEKVFREHRPDRVFHAAAYKHVPMMEGNPREAVRNNVVGTWRVADAAGRHGAEKFVLVSTDKAVRPVSIMGATKRLAELVVLELQEQHHDTTYAAVRFGNVLGSNGSVIPIFKRQLAAGKPLTVTHPEATRFFMTIPEAVQLILQASLLPEVRGSIAMLEMGEPVRIADLANNLLELSGLKRSSGDRIVYTGLRPGERLHEQLVAPNEETERTGHAKVRIVRTRNRSGKPVLGLLEEWERLLAKGDEAAVLTAMAECCGGRDAVGRHVPGNPQVAR